MQKKTTISLLILILALTISSTTFATDAKALQSQQKEPDLLFLLDTFQYIKDTYPFEVEDSELIENSLKGMLQSLDPYSDYYTEEEASELYKNILGVFSGIGVYIEEKDFFINIKDIIKGSPGERAGLKKDDLIISIDGKDIRGISIKDAQKLIQGQIGTKVKLGIKRTNKSLPIYIEITRNQITINPVEYKLLQNKIGYIKLHEFSESATKEMENALERLDKMGVEKIILDIRDNPGGLLDQSIKIARQFVPSGPIVHIQEKNKDLTTYISTNKSLKYKLVLLVNERSASASEILAAAIKDTKAGTIIGRTTYGKGIVQSMIPLANGSIIKMTTAEYLSPNKTKIHGKGVVPDIVVQEVEWEDATLRRAVKYISNFSI